MFFLFRPVAGNDTFVPTTLQETKQNQALLFRGKPGRDLGSNLAYIPT